MSIPFDELSSKEVLIIPPTQTIFVLFKDVEFVKEMRGSLITGEEIRKPGLLFKIDRTFPTSTSVEWRLWNRRSIQLFRPFIEAGFITQRWFKITRTGEGPQSDYVPVMAPAGFEPTLDKLVPGPIV